MRRNLTRKLAAKRISYFALALIIVCGLCFSGCTQSKENPNGFSSKSSFSEKTDESSVDWDSLIDIEGMDFSLSQKDKDASFDESTATKIALSQGGTKIEGSGVHVDDSIVTVESAGTYVVSGSLADGQLKVNVGERDDVHLVLKEANITSSTGPALQIEQADKAIITLASQTTNTLSDGSDYLVDSEESGPNATLFSKADLSLNGEGTLQVQGNANHAINSKDDLCIAGGTYEVKAAGDGIRGKDCVKIAEGKIAIEAEGDGIKSSNQEDSKRGFVSIEGGTFNLKVNDDGVEAATYLRLVGGNGSIEAADHGFRSLIEATMEGGNFRISAAGKGMNAETVFTMNGGTFTVEASDEGIEAEKVFIHDGEVAIKATDDGINAAIAEREDGSTDKETQPENPDEPFGQTQQPRADSQEMQQQGRNSKEVESFQERNAKDSQRPQELKDMAQNPNDTEDMTGKQAPQKDPFSEELGNTKENRGVMPGDDQIPFERNNNGNESFQGNRMPLAPNASEDCLIEITGGTVTIDAGGDALDSNGYIEISGGTIYGSASDREGESALDYEYGGSISGGSVILVGPQGMALDFDEESSQSSVLSNASGKAGDEIQIKDSSGNIIASYTTPKAFTSVLLSLPQVNEGTIVVADQITSFKA